MEDHSANSSMKGVEQSDIGNGNTQGYANRRYPNSYGRKPAHRAEQANLLAAVLPRIEVGTAFGLRVELEDLVLSAPNPGKVTPVARTSHVCHLVLVEPCDLQHIFRV
jgi:hypothetical protein